MAKRTKKKTWQQAEAMQSKAVRFLRDVIGDDQKADEIEGLTVSEYATRKGLVLNPVSKLNKPERSKTTMANDITKADLEKENGELLDLLNDVWNELADLDSTTNKAQMVAAIDTVCEILNEYDSEAFPMEGDESSDEDLDEEAA